MGDQEKSAVLLIMLLLLLLKQNWSVQQKTMAQFPLPLKVSLVEECGSRQAIASTSQIQKENKSR